MRPEIEYLVFASWGAGPTARYVGTVDELRGGQWYEGKLQEIPELANRFSDTLGLQSANDVLLTISDGAGGIYRADVLAGGMEGVVVLVTVVMRSTDAATGVPIETTSAQSLTIIGAGLSPGQVKLKLVDLEEEKMRGLYPPGLWQAADWPGVSDRDAGKAVCFPVGTALKLPSVQLVHDEENLEWQFGVCEGVAKTFVISSVSPGLKRFFTALNLQSFIQIGQTLLVTGTAASDGRYTVANVTATYVQVNETVAVSAGGGTLRVMPHVLTAYRNGRVVSSTEYAVQHLHVPGTISNGNFASGATAWSPAYFTTAFGFTPVPHGSSTITFGVGGCTVTSISSVDYAFLQQFGVGGGTFSTLKGARVAVQIRIAAGATDAVAIMDAVPTTKYRCKAGKTTTLILECGVTGNTGAISIGVFNFAGSVTIESVRFVPLSAVLLQFAREQLDFQGSPYVVECDVLSIESRNVADEISRLLTQVGLTPDAATFATAAGIATTEVMLVDCDYGRSGQRRISAILGDLLFIARGGLARTSAGAYALWQDVAGSVVASYDESLGDSIEVESYERGGRPRSVGIKYRPGAIDPRELQNTITRAITGGMLGDENPREIPYLRDHVAADRLLSYRAARAVANGVANATIYRQQRALGEVLTIASSINWNGPLDWKIRSVSRVPNANALELIQYDAAVYTYVPSPAMGQDSTDTYLPDYSATPPAVPSQMRITSADVSLTRDGTSAARIGVRAMPPALNWSELWFAVIHNVTGEIIRQQGVFGGVFATANIGGLRAGEVYQLKSYAINSFGVQGVILDTFDATVLGGGGAVTTFTAPGVTVLPPDVPSITLDQGTGRLINVSWTPVSLTADNLAEYVLERNPGTGTFTQIWTGRALSYVDRNVNYATNYTYRVKARDRWGNLSANWRTSSSLTLTRNISGSGSGDIMDTTVETVNRTAVSFVIVNVPMGVGVFQNAATVAHGMVKTPIPGIIGGRAAVIGAINAIDATNVTVRAYYFGNFGTTQAAVGPGSHTHSFGALGATESVQVAFW